MKKLMRFVKRIIIAVLIFGILGGGWFYYNRYKTEKMKKIAEEEKRRQEEIEKEKQRKLIEEKRKMFDEYVSEIEKYYKEEKNYKKVKELIDEAVAIAKQYNFPVDKINQILHQIEIETYLSKLKKLEKENEDIYKYLYVRNEVSKIPSLKETLPLKNEIIKKTYENEYKVKLIIAKNAVNEGKEGSETDYNYFLSKKIYSDAKKLRMNKGIEKDKIEDEIEKGQNELYFASENLYKNTIPKSLY
jgi:hypothetical protein